MNNHSTSAPARQTSPERRRKSSPEATRREKERADHRQTMLSAAERVFVRNGFRDATIAEIAREAEFAVGTFYNFFKSKDDLYAQVLDGIVREFVAEFERDVQQRDDPVDALSALIDLRMRVFDRHREFFRLFFEQSAAGVKLTGRHLKLREQYRASVAAIFAQGLAPPPDRDGPGMMGPGRGPAIDWKIGTVVTTEYKKLTGTITLGSNGPATLKTDGIDYLLMAPRRSLSSLKTGDTLTVEGPVSTVKAETKVQPFIQAFKLTVNGKETDVRRGPGGKEGPEGRGDGFRDDGGKLR